jgi:hypothetical protein
MRFDERWPEYETSHLSAISTIVDPRNKDCSLNNSSFAAVAHSLYQRYYRAAGQYEQLWADPA